MRFRKKHFFLTLGRKNRHVCVDAESPFRWYSGLADIYNSPISNVLSYMTLTFAN